MAQIKKLASRQHHYFTLNVNEVADSVSVNNNTSDVNYSFVLSPKVKGYDWSIGNQITYTITINGSTVATGHIPSYNGTSTVTLKSGTITIPHNNGGAKTIDIAFNVTDSTSYSFTCGNASGSDNLVLTTIARATKIISATPVNIGKNTSISFNKYNDNFTQSVYYRKKGDGPNDWITIVEKTSSSPYSWQIPTSLYAEIPNSPSIKLEFYAKTFNGNADLGNSDIIEQTFTATDEDDDFPTITSGSVVSIDTTTTNLVGSSRMIRYISTVQVTITANAKNSSSISSITINGIDAELTTSGTSKTGVATFTKASTYSYQVVVTDSRGNSITSSYSITWTNYIPLTLNVTLSRNEPTDGKVNISFSGNYYNSSFRKSDDTYVSNTLTVQYTSREAGGSWGNWTTISHTKSGNTYSGSTQLSNYDYTKQYEFNFQAVDQVSTIPQNGIIVSKGEPIYWWNDSSFNVNGNSNIIGNVKVGTIKTKNMWNNNTFVHNSTGGITTTTTGFNFTRGSETGGKYVYNTIPIESGKTYTMSLSGTASSIIMYSDRIYGTIIAQTANDTLTFTPNYTGNVIASIILGSTVTSATITNIQFEEGSVVTNYSTYQGIGYVSGKNANGYYQKFDDGTLIQYGEATFGNSGSTTDSYVLVTFPIRFAVEGYKIFAQPRYTGNISQNYSLATILTPSPGGVSNNYIYRRLSYYTPSDTANQSQLYACTQPIYWYAIGKWK